MACSHQPVMYDAKTGSYPRFSGGAETGQKFPSMFKRDDLHREYARRGTFLLWPKSAQAHPDDLAAAGFYFTGSDDTCQCYSCGLRLRNWSANDDPWNVHDKHAPRCELIVGGGCSRNVPRDRDPHPGIFAHAGYPGAKQSNIGDRSSSSDDATGKKKIGGKPLKGKMANAAMRTKKARLESFEGKWRKCDVVTPEELSDVGFYYGRDRDRVICAYCGLKLVNWQAGDSAYGEHFKHSPKCPMVQGQVEPEEEEDANDFLLFLKDDDDVYHTRGDGDRTPFEQSIDIVKRFGYSDEQIQMALQYLKTTAASNSLRIDATDLLDAVYQVVVGDDDGGVNTAGGPPPPPTTNKCENDLDLAKLKEENARLKMKCRVCRKDGATVLLLPCRHLVSCRECSPGLTVCPVCKGRVKGVINTFFA